MGTHLAGNLTDLFIYLDLFNASVVSIPNEQVCPSQSLA